MTNQQAEREAKKRWGTKYAVQNNGHMSSQERRDTAMASIRQLRAEKETVEKEMAERLKNCDWYQALVKRRNELTKEIQKVMPEAHRHRFSVGRLGGVAGFQFFEVLGSGDTWEDAFEQAEKRGR